MNGYLIARKIVQVVVLVLLMAVFIFIVFRLMPGNPAELFVRDLKGRAVTKAQITALEQQLGLYGGKWSLTDFLIYMRDMFTFNFGMDYYQQASVWGLIERAMPYTLLLLGSAAILSFVVGLPLGIEATWWRGRKKEAVAVTSSLVLNSIPFFVLAIILLLYLTIAVRLFPIRSTFPYSYFLQPSLPHVAAIIRDIALPLIVLLVVEAAGHLLTMRAAMISVLGEDFIQTARAKGVSEHSIMFHHAARNAMIPVSTRMALEFALLTSGAVIVGIIFSWPGIGPLIYQATLQEDYPFAEGAFFVISLIVILAYSVIDFVHAWLDPRISL